MNTKKRNIQTPQILMKTDTRLRRRSTFKSSRKNIVETPEEARALGARMARESAQKLKLRLTA